MHAGSIPDPKILVAGSGYSEVLYELNFTFAANATGGGSFDFYNASGVDWVELSIATPMPYGFIDDVWVALDSPTYYDVSSDLFVSSALSFGAGGLTIRFSGLDDGHNGIPSLDRSLKGEAEDDDPDEPEGPRGSHFSVNLDTDPGTPGEGGWLGLESSPLAFAASANPVPEPGTFVLVLGSLLAVGLGSRRRR